MNRKIFSVLGVLPEPGGYAIAKFSRTAVYKSYQDWVMELTEEGAEKFYDSFYFQYGHGSIADLAHLMVVFENISVPARNILFDEQLIDAQSRSTRYVDYSKGTLVTPPELQADQELLALFEKTTKEMIAFYGEITEKTTALYLKQYASQKPADMDGEAFGRLVHARAFDIARYLLPCAIPKSMGIIANGRTWERIISRFLSSSLLECQQIGKELQEVVCQKEAFNPTLIKLDKVDFLTAEQKEKVKKLVGGKNIGLPTLVKYAQKKEYPGNVYRELAKRVDSLGITEDPDQRRGVELHENINPEIDLVATLFYKVSPYPFNQILTAVSQMPPGFIEEIINLSYELRGQYDSAIKAGATGNLTFDICVDIGGFRDLHRHRNCIHVLKEVTPVYGFDMPKEIVEIGLAVAYQEMMKKAEGAYYKIEEKHPGVGQYVLPQATRRRFLMRMSPWELQYIAELRTRPSGHQSYREISFQMYQEFAKKYPLRAKHFRVVSPEVVDFFKR